MISFADTIELRPAGENLWVGDADTDYSHPAGQFGGWTAAALLKAVMMEPGERGLPLSMTVLFPDAVGAGPIEIRTRPLRTGARLQFWRAELASGRLVRPFPTLLVSDRSHWLVYPEGRRNQPKIAAFRDWILAEVEAEKSREPAELFIPPAAR